MATALLIVHGLVAVALLGAITHQTLAAWVPMRARPGTFFGRFRAVSPAPFANAVVLLYLLSALLGGIVYLYFRVDIRPDMERAGQWVALGLFDLKEHFISIGSALLPAYWLCWRRPYPDEPRLDAPSADDDPGLHGLVGFPGWACGEQHHGFSTVTSTPRRRLRLRLRDRVRSDLCAALKFDLALFTVFPSLGIVLGGHAPPRNVVAPSMSFLAPAMYWYGWTATAGLGALVIGALAAWLPDGSTRRAWLTGVWVAPMLAMAACVYLTMPWFRF